MVIYTSAKNEDGKQQRCVYAQCVFSDIRAGPIWGQTVASIRRALATLTQKCDCPAKYHVMTEWSGKRPKAEPAK